MLYSLTVFNRRGACVYYAEWNRGVPSAAQHHQQHHQQLTEDAAERAVLDDQRLLYGMLWSMKLFCAKLAPPSSSSSAAAAAAAATELHCFRTAGYKLHVFESPTGVTLAAATDPAAADLHDALGALYRDAYVEFVAKNPFIPDQLQQSQSQQPSINCDLFSAHVQRFVRQLACFRS